MMFARVVLPTAFAILTNLMQLHAAVVVDDFNDGSTSGWTTRAGTVLEFGGNQTGTRLSFATMNGVAGSTIGVDATVNSNSVGYIALGLNYSSLSDFLFVKIQDNGGAQGLFDTVFFYHGNSFGDGLVGPDDSFTLSTEVASTYFEARDNGDGTASAYIGATGQTFVGTLVNSYSGTGVGLGYGDFDAADNFYVSAVPEPPTLSILSAICLLAFFIRGRLGRGSR